MTTELERVTLEFLRNRHELMAFIRGLVPDAALAEDIFQEVWLRLEKATQEGQDIAEVRNWCRGVARRLILHHWRQQRRSKLVADEELLDLADQAFRESPMEELTGEREEALQRCLEELPEHARQILRLKYQDGKTAAEIGQQLGRTAAAILMALSRIRRSLADCVHRRLGWSQETP